MKTKLSYILFIFIMAINIQLKAQEDSIYYNYNDTCIGTTINHYDKLLKHIIPDKIEINKQFKVDLFRLSLLQPNLSFETRLKNNKTIEVETIIGESQWGYYINDGNKSLLNEILPDKHSIFYCTLSSDVRHYYNFDRRNRLGKNTNGFSGNYFSTGMTLKMAFYDTDYWHISNTGTLRYSPTIEKQNPMFSSGKMHQTQSLGYLNIGYGLQRRIGNKGFYGAEFKTGVGTNKHFETLYIAFELNLRVGFSFSSLKQNK